MITLHKHDISANIKDRYATVIYSFNFENLSEIRSSNELKFELTIDPNAFISRFEANIDGEIFIGQTKEKEVASKEYNEAKAKDENAIIITQPHKNISNVFQIKTNIDSKSKILLTIQIEQYLQKKFNFNNLTIQILKSWSTYNIKQNFDHISFNINIDESSGIYGVDIPNVDNNNNAMTIDKQIMDKMGTKCVINGKLFTESSINELIFKYKVKGEENESNILFDNNSKTFCHVISDIIMSDSVIMDEKTGDTDEGVATDGNIIKNDNILIPRRVMFVIDRSGSMSGAKWDKTIAATVIAIKQLRSGVDRFGIILFDNSIQLLPYKEMRGCLLADDKNISDSINALKTEKTGGSTNINIALLKAIEIIKIDILLLNNDINCKYNFFMNQIMFITDGAPNSGERDTTKIVTNVKNANDVNKIDKYNDKISIFSFGVGRDSNDSGWIKDLNHSFLKVLSLNNNGFYERIKEMNVDTAFKDYFSILSKPILSNIDIQYKNKNISHVTNTKFNALFSGNDLIVCGKVQNNTENLLLSIAAITGKQITEENSDKSRIKPINICKQIKIHIDTDNKENDTNTTERIWCYLTLQQYAKQKLIYTDMIEIDDDEQKQNESLPLSLALKYKFVTPWTSMIVVKKKDEQINNTEPVIQDDIKQNDINDNQAKTNKKKKNKKKKKRKKNSTPMIEEEENTIDFSAFDTPRSGGMYAHLLKNIQARINSKPEEDINALDIDDLLGDDDNEIDDQSLDEDDLFDVVKIMDEAEEKQEMDQMLQDMEKQAEEKRLLMGKTREMEEKLEPMSELVEREVQSNEPEEDEDLMENLLEAMEDTEPEKQEKEEKEEEDLDLMENLLDVMEDTYEKELEQRQKTQEVQRKYWESLHEIFTDLDLTEIDENDDNRIELSEFKNYIKVNNLSAPLYLAENIFYTIDNDRNGFISPIEYLRWKRRVTVDEIGVLTEHNISAGIGISAPSGGSNMPTYHGSSYKYKILSSVVLTRILKELKNLENSNVYNISAGPIGDDATIWNATIIGPNNSPYDGYMFLLEIIIPSNYPIQPPKCKFITKIYHCNIGKNGEIDLNLLNDKWSPVVTIKKLLLEIIKLLGNSNAENPLVDEIAKMYKENRKEYDKIAREWCQKYGKMYHSGGLRPHLPDI